MRLIFIFTVIIDGNTPAYSWINTECFVSGDDNVRF